MEFDTDLQFQPLAMRMRPKSLEDFVGQQHLLQSGKPLRSAIEKGVLHSMILWGPPGCGKTTLAELLAQNAHARVERISAVLAGVKELREIVARAKEAQSALGQATILFVDEIHRFNKAQQDAFLPIVEDGLLTLVGATTENPSFSLSNALLSRARVYVLYPLTEDDLSKVIDRVLKDEERGLGKYNLKITTELRHELISGSDGDARQLLGLLEQCVDLGESNSDGEINVTAEMVAELLSGKQRRFDRGGDYFYDQISALHKSVRGSNPDAALYWFCRMLDGGCDPRYLARRIIRMASEDIGNADPRAVMLAENAARVYERLGSPEGELALAQVVLYLAVAPKSNAVYVAFNEVMREVKQHNSLEVPLHLRNAPTKLMKKLGFGKEYRYPHDEPRGYIPNEQYFPDGMEPKEFYRPVARGLEIKIREKLAELRRWDREAKK